MLSRPLHERIVNCGPHGDLIGIAIDPAQPEGEIDPSTPMVLFLNAGVIHRIGPHRLHVTLARRLAGEGFSSLRIDLSGIGDSPSRSDPISMQEMAVADVRTAMDQAQRDMGAQRFILFGLCSGADNALATASQDERIVGLLLLDPPGYSTWRSRLRKAQGRINAHASFVDAARWSLRVAARRLAKAWPARQALTSSAPTEPYSEQNRRLPRKEYGQYLDAALARHVRILCVYSGGNDAGYNHDKQLFEFFPRLRRRLDVRYFGAANHVFTERAAREELLDCVIQWCRKQFAPESK